MGAPFPLGLPLPTAFYLTLYVLTLVVHVAFMNYVLAGTGWLAAANSGPWRRDPSAATKVLKDWMPLMLSGAITAGIAPLLFVQILYKRGFYTANLLLFNRWMAILPVLIVGFYALYLLKSGWLSRRVGWLIAAVGGVPFAAVAFTGYSWTENHLLSVREPAFWGEFYATTAQMYWEPQLLPRLLVWGLGSLPTLAVVLGWQLWYDSAGGARAAARLALTGLGLAAAAAGWYAVVVDAATRQAFVSPMALPYFAVAGVGLAVQAAGWVRHLRDDSFTAAGLATVSSGLALTLVGMTVCREAARIASLGADRFESLYPIHAAAFGKGGFAVFLAFFALNGGLIGLCFWVVKSGMVSQQEGLRTPGPRDR